MRDPRLDPRPGDVVCGKNRKLKVKVLEVVLSEAGIKSIASTIEQFDHGFSPKFNRSDSLTQWQKLTKDQEVLHVAENEN